MAAKKKKHKKRELKITVDLETGASYIRIKEGKIAETQTIDEVVNADVDRYGNVLGIEILK
jgi:uncharacterized protein YuzE